mmetsp:Transcript_62460/g.181095  ORF Transcript_62460/g.181095 Transcript_62460/m.181095 type:complete len:572 (-) Transcript_62460:61-1776(-)
MDIAADLFLGAAVLRALLAPSLDRADVAVVLVAAELHLLAAVLALPIGPQVLVVRQAIVAVVGFRRLRACARHALVLATPSDLLDRPSPLPVRVALVAVVFVALRAALVAAVVLLLIVPFLLPIRRPGLAIHVHRPMRSRAVKAFVLATPLQLVHGPSVRMARALVLVASRAAVVATPILLLVIPRLLPVLRVGDAVIRQRRCLHAADLLLVAAPRLLLDRPLVGGADVAAKRVAPLAELHAAILLHACAPTLLPIRPTVVAIVGDLGRGNAAQVLVAATPGLLLARPAVLRTLDVALAIVGLALREAHTATEGLLRVVPACLPVVVAHLAIEGLGLPGRHYAAQVLLLATPLLLVRRPSLHVARVAIEGLAQGATLMAAELLLPLRPLLFPTARALFAIVLDSRRRVAADLLLLATPDALVGRPTRRVVGAGGAVEGVAALAEFLATPFLLARAPAFLPVRPACLAIEAEGGGRPRRRRGDVCAADGPLLTAPSVLRQAPLGVALGEILGAVVGVAAVAVLQAAKGLLLLAPRALPMILVGPAIVVGLHVRRQRVRHVPRVPQRGNNQHR